MLIDPHAPPSPLPSHSELMDPVPVLAYAAAVTSRITLGTGIVILPLRNPVILAKELATIDVLSQGRLEVGIGVGYVPGEYEAIGVPFETRGRRADEWIDALRTLWRDEQPELRGEFASFGGIQCRPQPHRPGGPPIIGERHGDARRAAAASSAATAGTASTSTPTTRRRRSTSSPASATRSTVRPSWASSRSPSPRCRDRSTPTPCAATRTSGVDRLVVVQDFGDMAGGPDAARRGKFLDEMAATAERLDIRLTATGEHDAEQRSDRDAFDDALTGKGGDGFVAVLAPGAVIWHNHDRNDVDARDNMAAVDMLSQIVDELVNERRLFTPIDDGFVLQYVTRGKVRSNGNDVRDAELPDRAHRRRRADHPHRRVRRPDRGGAAIMTMDVASLHRPRDRGSPGRVARWARSTSARSPSRPSRTLREAMANMPVVELPPTTTVSHEVVVPGPPASTRPCACTRRPSDGTGRAVHLLDPRRRLPVRLRAQRRRPHQPLGRGVRLRRRCRSSTASRPSTRTPRRSTTATPGSRWTAQHADELGIDPARIVIVGRERRRWPRGGPRDPGARPRRDRRSRSSS